MDSEARGFRRVVLAQAVAIVGMICLGVTAAVTSPVASASSNGTAIRENPDVSSAPQHGLGHGGRIISWSGYRWLVYPPGQHGPEGNLLSSSRDAVHVDSQGRLHLAITKVHGKWRCAEIESLVPMSYGTYRWVVDTAIADFAPTTVLGMFVYRPGSKKLTNEIDVEDSQFTHLVAPNNAQFAIQPYFTEGNLHPYAISSTQVPIFQQFEWLPGKPGDGVVHFQTNDGDSADAPLITKWDYDGYAVPTPFNEHLYIDLWLNVRRPPVGGTYSAVIRSFHYSPVTG